MSITENEPVVGRALVVDDERDLADIVAGYLRRDGFEVSLAYDGIEALRLAHLIDPDLVILDLNLPSQDGIEVCRLLRTFSDCYVIMLTARTEEVDMLIGLSVGADDYITKPFSPRELAARVKARMRRPRNLVVQGIEDVVDPDMLTIGELRIHLTSREASLGDQLLDLTRIEFDLLATLAREPKIVFTRSQLIATVWGGEWFGDERLVDVHLTHVRQKLGDTSTAQRFIRTVRGVGYRIGEG